MRPSFLCSIISGILILVGIILSEYETIMILFAMAISLGIHGIHGMQHAYEEMYYDFNPLEGKILPKDMLTKKEN